MKIKEELAKLKDIDVYSLMLFAMFKLRDIPEYASLSEMVYILDKDSLLKLKLINFNPISKKDRKQVKKIYKLIYETQYLIRVNDQISLSYSCILLYYNMFIYQDNKNDEVCNFINDSFNKNIIKNKELL